MSRSESSRWSARIFAAIYILAIFSVGIAAGAGLHRLLVPRPARQATPKPPMFGPLPLEDLGLTTAQWQQVRKIMERHRPAFDKVLKETYPKVRAVTAKIDRDIRKILTAEQRQRLDRLRSMGGPPPHGHRPPPGPPPFGRDRRGMPPGPPPGSGPTAPPGFHGPPGGPRSPSGSLGRARSQPLGAAAKRVLGVLKTLETHPHRMANVPRSDGRLLRLLVEAVNAQRVVEVGTSNGYSGLWMALGLLHTGGRITTFEIDAKRAVQARAHFTRAGVNGLVTVEVGDGHKKVAAVKGPIDVLFLDADKPGYLDYLNQLLPKVRPGGLIIAHNMVSPPPDPRFVKAITTDPALETVFVNLRPAGIAVSLKKRALAKRPPAR